MPKEQRGFKYKKRTREDLKERANMRGGNYDSIFKPKFKQWKPKEGKNVIRILPPTWDDARHYGFDIFVNYSIGADNQAYLSLSKHQNEADPIAEARNEALKEGEKKLADKLRPNQRILYWIIDRNDEDEGPLLWPAPFTFDKSLSNLCIDEDTKDVIFIDDPNKGRDVRFYREGTGLNTNYDPSKMKMLAESSVHEDEGQEQEWLEFIQDNPLPDVLNFYSYDHIKGVFDGQVSRPDDDDDDEAEEKPRSRKPTPSRRDRDEEDAEPPPRTAKRKPAPEPEEDDPEDEEVEEKPVRGKRRAPPVEDDDEPEEKPARRQRARMAEPEDDAEEDESPPPKSRRGKTVDDEETGGSLRDRIAARRRRPSTEDDD